MRNETVLHPLSISCSGLSALKFLWMMLPATFPTSPLYEWYFSFRTLAKQLQVMHDTLHPFVIDMGSRGSPAP